MKFGNFENLGKKTKNMIKAVAFTAAGFSAGSMSAQSNEVPTQTGRFLDRLKEVGIVDEKVTSEEFAKIPESEMKILAQKYKEKTGAVTREELPKGKEYTTISRTVYGIDEKNSSELKEDKQKGDEFNFDEWFAKQKPGSTVQAPNGKWYKIEFNQNKNITRTVAEKSNPQNMTQEEDNTMASAGDNSEEFILLKDKKFEK